MYPNLNSDLRALQKLPIRVESHYGVAIGDGKIIATSDDKPRNAGAVFGNILNAKKITFTLYTDTYCQFGMCDPEATLPDIMLTGNGRGEYLSVSKAGTYDINFNCKAGNFFIGGDKGMQIGDIYVSDF